MRRARSIRPTRQPRFKWQIIPDVMVRVSYGTGFLPPAVNQTGPTPASTIAPRCLNYVDPRRGNEPVTGTLTTIGGGNPNLQPEKSKSWSSARC